jgi:hypothetical protein
VWYVKHPSTNALHNFINRTRLETPEKLPCSLDAYHTT